MRNDRIKSVKIRWHQIWICNIFLWWNGKLFYFLYVFFRILIQLQKHCSQLFFAFIVLNYPVTYFFINLCSPLFCIFNVEMLNSFPQYVNYFQLQLLYSSLLNFLFLYSLPQLGDYYMLIYFNVLIIDSTQWSLFLVRYIRYLCIK